MIYFIFFRFAALAYTTFDRLQDSRFRGKLVEVNAVTTGAETAHG